MADQLATIIQELEKVKNTIMETRTYRIRNFRMLSGGVAAAVGGAAGEIDSSLVFMGSVAAVAGIFGHSP